MAEDGWRSPPVIMGGASSMFAYRLCVKLVEKSVLSQPEAASIFTATADDIRSGTEDGSGEKVGEALARSYEKMASWMLGYGGET